MQNDIIIFIIGVIVGGMNSIAGGGMLIGFPVLTMLGIPPLVANATGHLATTGGLFSATFGYREYLRKVPRRYALLLAPVALAAAAGTFYLRSTPAEQFKTYVPLLLLFGVALFAFQPLLHFHLYRHIHGHTSRLLPIILVGLALIPICFYGGYFGVGFGFLMLAFLGFTSIRDAHMMNAIKNLTACVVGVVSIICLTGSGLIDWRVGCIMLAGTTLGGFFGSRMAQKVSSHLLRIVITIIGIAAAVYFALSSS
ncbi:sulfite exporter TauE/SafE family protein [Candidatus Saccharibacteria bacterium]|nr:sulfite exporter TauE/SafE family protein [Candidatus Saccharibacteria bacterium]